MFAPYVIKPDLWDEPTPARYRPAMTFSILDRCHEIMRRMNAAPSLGIYGKVVSRAHRGAESPPFESFEHLHSHSPRNISCHALLPQNYGDWPVLEEWDLIALSGIQACYTGWGREERRESFLLMFQVWGPSTAPILEPVLHLKTHPGFMSWTVGGPRMSPMDPFSPEEMAYREQVFQTLEDYTTLDRRERAHMPLGSLLRPLRQPHHVAEDRPLTHSSFCRHWMDSPVSVGKKWLEDEREAEKAKNHLLQHAQQVIDLLSIWRNERNMFANQQGSLRSQLMDMDRDNDGILLPNSRPSVPPPFTFTPSITADWLRGG